MQSVSWKFLLRLPSIWEVRLNEISEMHLIKRFSPIVSCASTFPLVAQIKCTNVAANNHRGLCKIFTRMQSAFLIVPPCHKRLNLRLTLKVVDFNC